MSLLSPKKTSLYSGVAIAGLATAFLAGGAFAPTTPVFAEAVRVEAPKTANFADVVEGVSPAVVSVRVKAKAQPASDRSGSFGFRDRGGLEDFGTEGLPEGHPLRRFFDGFNRGERRFGNRSQRRGGNRRGPRRFGQSQGSGFFVSEDGFIVTNNHVVAGGSEFEIVLNNGDQISATLIGTDPKTDLAVLKADDKRKYTYVTFSEKKSRVGEWVVAVGNPFGLGGTVTAGIVSANGRDIGSGPYDDFIQIDAAVNKGNSGGPAFNLNGEVIGVNTAIFSPSGGNVGIAFAISASTAQEVVDDLIKNGVVTRGWLGVQIQPVTKEIAESLGLASAQGTIIAEAQDGSPAQKAGLRSGDVVLKVDGKSVKSPKVLARLIANLEPNDTTKLTVFRDGAEQIIDVKLGKLPGSNKLASAAPMGDITGQAVDLDQLGLSISPADGGVIISDVLPQGAAAKQGIRPGDEIVSINGRDTRSVNDVGRAVAQAIEDDRKAVLFQLRSGERSRFIAIPLERS